MLSAVSLDMHGRCDRGRNVINDVIMFTHAEYNQRAHNQQGWGHGPYSIPIELITVILAGKWNVNTHGRKR